MSNINNSFKLQLIQINWNATRPLAALHFPLETTSLGTIDISGASFSEDEIGKSFDRC